MRLFRTDDVSNEERAGKIAEIKKIAPNFEAEDKSDAYIAAYHDAITATSTKNSGEKQQEGTPEDEDNQTSKDSKDQDEEYDGHSEDLQKIKLERLNMRNRKKTKYNYSSDSSADEIEKNKQSRLNMRGE